MSTTTATRPAATRVSGRTRPLAGTGTLLRFNLRQDRIRLPLWIGGIALVQISGPSSYEGIYPGAAERQEQATVVGDNPAMKALTGPGHGLDDYTYGAMMTNEYLGFMVIAVALMSVFMVVRHTRTEEETGRAELVRAGVVGRYAQLTAAVLAAALANLVLGLLIAAGMAGQGIESIDWTGSLLFGAAYAAVGLFFAGVAAVTAQITEHARAASGMAGALIGVAYAIRAAGDMADSGLSWLSPIGWAQATAAYVDDNWWPLGLAAMVTAALVATAFALSDRRDIGAGLRDGRGGAATATPFLGTPAGFAWRLHRASVVWWGIAVFAFGFMYGSVIQVIEDYADNDVVQQMIEQIGGASITESWLSMIISILAIVCTIFAVIAALRPRREETSGRAEPVLATALSRTRWVATHLGIALGGGAVVLLLSGLGLGLGAVAATGDAGYLGQVVGATLGYAPALWLTTALAVAVFGLVPRAAGLSWALLVYAMLIVYLGGLLDLPGWMFNLSPYTHIPAMPADSFTALPLVILTAIAAALIAIGLAGFRRRDLEAT
ncbi:ABC transporter permease [Micromonospora sp. CPCC 205371]|nr:ABC transporter permease [Micromonospora sp. CPCC 205371]